MTKWISVNDDLPEEDVLVLVCCIYEPFGRKIKQVGHALYFGGNKNYNWEYCDGKVTHWMPLPEPPES